MQLAGLGVSKLTLVARRGDRLRDLQARLVATYPHLRVDLFPADLGNEDVVTGLMKTWDEAGFAPDILISNAGFGDLGTFESSEPAKIELMLAVNVVALTRLTRWLVPQLLQKGAGWICHVGSTAGTIPLPSFAVYGGTKAYVNSFFRSTPDRIAWHRHSGASLMPWARGNGIRLRCRPAEQQAAVFPAACFHRLQGESRA